MLRALDVPLVEDKDFACVQILTLSNEKNREGLGARCNLPSIRLLTSVVLVQKVL